MSKTIAVMQPYFFPYAGYFRIFAAADTVVLFDCVQFPRRGWVHRNRFANRQGEMEWLTLPLLKMPRDARIDALRFPPDAAVRLEAEIERFPVLASGRRAGAPLVQSMLEIGAQEVTPYLAALVARVTQLLGIEKPTIRSSSLPIDPELRAQERVLSIVKTLGGTHYVNPPGGRPLYDRATFERAGVGLSFLKPYGGSTDSILSRLLTESAETVGSEVRIETVLED